MLLAGANCLSFTRAALILADRVRPVAAISHELQLCLRASPAVLAHQVSKDDAYVRAKLWTLPRHLEAAGQVLAQSHQHDGGPALSDAVISRIDAVDFRRIQHR